MNRILWMCLAGCGPQERLLDPGFHPEDPCEDDDDEDGVGVCADNCPDVGNADQADEDQDGTGDVCDDCSVPASSEDPVSVGDRCGCQEPLQCTDGAAGPYPCDQVDLLSFVPLSAFGASSTNDVWGWTDPTSHQEYVLLGLDSGVVFLDVSDPYCPVHVGTLPSTGGVSSPWRDLETWADHVYVGSEAPGHGIQVFALSHLAEYAGEPVTFGPDEVYDGIGLSHTITVDPVGGYLSANGSDSCGGLHLVDLADPALPVFGSCAALSGYVHDSQCVTYHGPDTDHIGASICVTANGTPGTVGVIDVSDLGAPVEIGEVDYLAEGAVYAHQGWFTEDHTYFLFGDELDEEVRGVETTTWVFDLRDLDHPEIVGRFVNDTRSIDHQQYVRGDRVYQANYTSGLRILDLTGVATAGLEEVAFFDVFPQNDARVFEGAWSNYPWFESGVVPVSSIHEGLFLLRPRFDP